jgi:hypothetical protein
MLTIELQVNYKVIERIHAVRLSDGKIPTDEVNRYCIYSQDEASQYDKIKHDQDHQILHRYSDGAKVLARKMLEKMGGNK